jgi:hypothetical protein
MALLDRLITGVNLPPAPTGSAAIYYRIGTQPPVQVLTSFFHLTDAGTPNSLVLWFYTPAVEPVQFLLMLAIEGFYLGPGEYKGNVNDIRAGMGLAGAGGASQVWTAGTTTATDLQVYVAPHGALIGTFTSSGLVPGPLLGPPDDPPPPDQPAVDIQFTFFSSASQPQ